MFAQSLLQLQQDLANSRDYWQFIPFEHNRFPWQERNPALSQTLNALTGQQIQELDEDPKAARALLKPLLPPLPGFSEPRLRSDRGINDPYPFWLSTGVKGRKWQQVVAFSRQIRPNGQHFLEWCAGKGHLGRVLGWQHRRPVQSLEWQASLCQSGQQQSDKQAIDQRFVHCDVINDDTWSYLSPQTHAVALHACGDLHTSLLHRGAKAQIPAISISPCCYHKTVHHEYQPLSQAAQRGLLSLHRPDLKLAVQETVTAGARESRKRQQEKFSRILFDLWQRQCRGSDTYLPVPSAPDAVIKRGALAFCQWAAHQKALSAPSSGHIDNLITEAQKRQRQMAQMELVQHLYRQALEYYLVLDRCQFLAEQGYEVALTAFCERQVTPRNLLITANLPTS